MSNQCMKDFCFWKLETEKLEVFGLRNSHMIHKNFFTFINLGKHLLNDVIFGWFTTDYIEKDYGKLCKETGGAYFITVKKKCHKEI